MFNFKNIQIDSSFKPYSFSADNNDKVGIVGKNGSGKSTLLNIIYKN